ncbi:MAG: hypothetical protein DHS80DRAFT_22133 [Piptocephalis tieghemiana]|nr:MAG: hypothetical protein DHS80DRAFT_22133 [Piptocephalis tieghemiana]
MRTTALIIALLAATLAQAQEPTPSPTSPEGTTGGQQPPQLTNEQLSQLVNLLQNNPNTGASSPSGGANSGDPANLASLIIANPSVAASLASANPSAAASLASANPSLAASLISTLPSTTAPSTSVSPSSTITTTSPAATNAASGRSLTHAGAAMVVVAGAAFLPLI